MIIKVNSTKKPHPGDCNDIASRKRASRTSAPSDQYRNNYDNIFRKGRKAR